MKAIFSVVELVAFVDLNLIMVKRLASLDE